ncbi:MAG TPA: hypothetical protein VLG50_01640, partial [Candidatus Saccharimonadales bacterium]|nr:hypothetical protein [Candidatus Saccharimonadales bacterium]
NPAFYRVYFQDTVVGTISAKCPLKFLYLLKRCSTTIPSLTMTAVAQDGSESIHFCVLSS